jgi:hypothetical protein
MASASQIIRLQVVLTGDVETTAGTSGHQNPSIVVRIGTLLTYVTQTEVIGTCLAAWHEAALASAHLSRATIIRPDVERDPEVTAVISYTDRPPFTVARYAAQDSRNGRPYVEVSLGAVLFVCRDRAAVNAVHSAWKSAAELARIVWDTPVNLWS